MSTYILGINAFHADAAAVLLRDGEVVGAIAEERLNRVKHFAGFPEKAICKLLDMAGISLLEVEHLAIGRDSTANLTHKLGFSVANIARIGKLAKQRLANRAQIADVPSLTAKACGVSRDAWKVRVHHVEHHLCHAASAFYPSGFERAAILSVDGFGDFASTMLAMGDGTTIDVLEKVYFPHSLGVLYTSICQFIGYNRYGDEGKVMGLAPYGKPVYRELLADMVRLKSSGRFELNLDYFIHHREGVDYSFDEDGHPTVAPLYSKRLAQAVGEARKPAAEIEQRNMDLAYSVQERLEQVYFHMLSHLHERTGVDAVCIAGGVGLNSVANGKIFENTPFNAFATHPAATDDGTAFGAAYHVHVAELGGSRPPELRHGYLGDEYTDDEVAEAIREAGLEGRLLQEDEVYAEAARRIADGKVVGWFQGRMEWGPRALGARSIVAHPGRPDMKDILNARIKHREWFRPFAPSILEEYVGDYFEQTWPTPFMTQVYGTRAEKRDELCAVDHVDHTGRLQTVSKDDCPRYAKLIEAFRELTGIPVVLNTSFNENEPIVCQPSEAIACYTRTKMDALVIGNWLLEKSEA